MVTDSDRRQLFTALERELGAKTASILMDLLPPVGWADVARQSDLVAIRGEMVELRAELKGEISELRGEMSELRAELKGEMSELRAELKGEMSEVRGEMSELRTQVAAQLPRLVTANIASAIGVAGLVLAAARLG